MGVLTTRSEWTEPASLAPRGEWREHTHKHNVDPRHGVPIIEFVRVTQSARRRIEALDDSHPNPQPGKGSHVLIRRSWPENDSIHCGRSLPDRALVRSEQEPRGRQLIHRPLAAC